MSNYELIKFKRFVSLFIVKLCNELFFSTTSNASMLHAYVQRFEIDIVEIFMKTKHGQSKSCETSFNELLGQPFNFLYHKSSSSSWSGGSGALPTLCLVVFLQSALHSTTTPSPHSLPLSLPPIFDYLFSDCYLSLLSNISPIAHVLWFPSVCYRNSPSYQHFPPKSMLASIGLLIQAGWNSPSPSCKTWYSRGIEYNCPAMRPETRLESAVFQLTPTRTRWATGSAQESRSCFSDISRFPLLIWPKNWVGLLLCRPAD